jgi:hypothetical protein
MKCTRCERREGNRGEMRFESDAIVFVYLCEECTESVLREDDGITGVEPTLE